MPQKLDPWKSSEITDYSKLFNDFGILPFADVLDALSHPHKYMKRGIIFGHRGFERIAAAIAEKKPFVVLDGFMPTGKAHFGHKMVMDQIIWYQRNGGIAVVGIADREAHAVRGYTWEECKRIGVEEYLVSLIALGLKPEKTRLYFQSEFWAVKDLAFELGTKVNFSELSAIYGFSGETHLAHMVGTVTQGADILHSQLKEFEGPIPVVVPVGADQDPHIRLTRELASKMNMFLIERREHAKVDDTHINIHGTVCQLSEPYDKSDHKYWSVRGKNAPETSFEEIEQKINARFNDISAKVFKEHMDIYGNISKEDLESVVREVELGNGGYAFIPPASTYHRFMTGLTGGKMSSSVPDSNIALSEDPKSAVKKIMKAKTGGRVTVEEQKELGGDPSQCSVYEFCLFHLMENDDELKQTEDDCRNGKILCGACKKRAAELLEAFLIDFSKKREEAYSQLPMFGINYKGN